MASLNGTKINSFRDELMDWHRTENKRNMPWKGISDVYKIWLSEIILQQTRVEQGTAYYEKMILTFPTVFDLARASEEKVMKLWEGLGYYSRCRNLHATAKYIVAERNGVFPDTYEELLKLKGVGPYTAAAIASFAYNIPKPVVDGNAIRVLSRYFGIREPADNASGRRKIEELAQECIHERDPAGYNQAIMDFGATVCKPINPLCSACCMQKNCFAYLNNAAEHLPVPSKQVKKKTRWFVFFIMHYKDKIAIRRRGSEDIWAGLYEFPSIEFSAQPKWLSAEKEISKKGIPFVGSKEQPYMIFHSERYSQQLTHRHVLAKSVTVKIKRRSDLTLPVEWIAKDQLEQFAFPKLIKDILKDAHGHPKK